MTLPGNPDALAERAATYVSSASRIERAADDLRALAYASTARSLDAIRERSGQVAGDLSAAHGHRLQPAAQPLRERARQPQGQNPAATRGRFFPPSRQRRPAPTAQRLISL